MGIGLRVFLVTNDEDRLQRISVKRFEGLWRGKHHLPEYAGQSVRYVLVVIETENRKPTAIETFDCGILKFDAKGKVDGKDWHRQVRLAIESMPSIINEPKSNSVIDARSHFSKKRYDREFKWQPSQKIQQAIEDAVFGSTVTTLRLV